MAREERERAERPATGIEPGALSILLKELAAAPAGSEPDSWKIALHPGLVVGKFELVREIGRGGFGVVWEARDRELNRSVAFKAVRASGDVALRQERLLREAEASASLSHPNLVTLFDAGRGEHGPYLVMELLHGSTLSRRLEAGPLPIPEAMRIGLAVARGVAHAHEHGVVHRDLKPDNVFLCDDGQVKVLDLGIAHAFGHRRVNGGTPAYMAPEQLEGAPEDERTDVFALGVMFFEMLTGQRLFPTEKSLSSASPAPALELRNQPALAELISRMLAKRAVERPRDGREVAAALAAFDYATVGTAAQGNSPVRARRRRLPPALLAAGAVVVAIGVVAVFVSRQSSIKSATGAPPPSIAVLPFADLSPQHDQGYFADGVAEEILIALAHVDGLRVPGRTSSFFYKGQNAKLSDIARELKVTAVLEGSVRKDGNRVRVSAQIVNVAAGASLWSATFDRDLTQVFAVQDEIARAVVGALKVNLAAGRQPTTSGYATPNPEVYRLFLLGRSFYARYSQENFRRAIDAYEKALAIDPGYAPAWAGIGVPLNFLAMYAPTPAEAEALRQRAIAAAEKAIALAPDLADALSTRGTLRTSTSNDWVGARVDLERAISLYPGDTDSRRRYAIMLHRFGRMEEARAAAKKAVELDPLSAASLGQLGWANLPLDDYDAAIASFQRALEVSPEAQLPLFGLAQALLLAGRPGEALAAFQRCPDEGDRLWGTAIAQHSLGDDQASRSALEAFTAKRGDTRPLDVATAHAWRGEKDAAFRWLERCLAQEPLDQSVRFDPLLRPLRSDDRFLILAARLKQPPN